MMETNTPKDIYFVRHPRTNAPPDVCYGNSEVLSEEHYIKEAVQKVRDKLQSVKPEICYTSPLLRCSMLAGELISENCIQTDERIREINFERWEMVPWVQIPEEEQMEWGNDFVNCRVHGGENFYDVQARVIDFWDDLIQTSHQQIMVVTHAGLLRAFLAYLLEASPRKIFAMQIDYGDVVQIQWYNSDYYKIKYL